MYTHVDDTLSRYDSYIQYGTQVEYSRCIVYEHSQ